MKARTWTTDGVHFGKKISELPITYLLWFVGSPIMRRTRWVECQTALAEIYHRLTVSVQGVEGALIDDLRPKSAQERRLIRTRKKAYEAKKKSVNADI